MARKCLLLVLALVCFASSITVPHFGATQPNAVNCSAYCSCDVQEIKKEISQRYQLNNALLKTKYGDDFKASSKYSDFLSIFTLVVSHMISITCNINDGRAHYVSSLLNGIENIKYTSLSVTCKYGEAIVWDVPAWQISFNRFESKKCNLEPDQLKGSIPIPMNMWIFEVDNVGENLMENIDVRYATNTISLAVDGTNIYNIPDKWKGDYMISLDRLSLRSNNLKRFDCKIHFTKDMDTIDLSNNDLSKFPDCLMRDNGVDIRYLSVANNAIDEISNLFHTMPMEHIVECIDLSHNLIEKIGTFMNLKKLEILDLSNNQILEINDDAFNHLNDLKQLHLQNNRIHYIGPVAFRANINLRILKLSNNHLKFVSSDQFPTQWPLYVDIRKNKLRTPPFMVAIKKGEFPYNIQLHCAQNPFHCDCTMVPFEEFSKVMKHPVMVNDTKGVIHFKDLTLLKCASPRANKGRIIQTLSFAESCFVLENCPPSCECVLMDKSNFVVNCTNRRLLEMPESIPIFHNTKTVLDLSFNPLQLLGHRSYLSNLSELYMDNCLMTSVSPLAIASLQDVKVLTLHNNLLHKLPHNTKNITLKKASNVTLHNNRWSCSCDSLWLPTWISMHRSAVWMPGKILCDYLKKPVEEFNSNDINCESFSNKDVMLAISMILSSIFSTFLLFFYYTKEIRLFLYTKLGIRICADFSYGDMFSPYDAFLSYGQDNYKWVVDKLVPFLESGPKKYKLCLHYRDFPSSEPNIDNIPWAIRLSRCSILILSRDFMKKEWCIMELRAIFQRLLMAANKLIVITTDDVTAEELTPDLRDYMTTHEYLRVGEDHFWEKLEMFLPPKDAITESSSIKTDSPTDHVSGDRELTEDANVRNHAFAEGDGDMSCQSAKNLSYEGGDCPNPHMQ